ncbi:MAG: hypothetical protein DRN30_03020 [Thermoplasmata archaeon]|nr:MAG: hypothetical protein DRN30_03020 [Thermoplasmata archaeon]
MLRSVPFTFKSHPIIRRGATIKTFIGAIEGIAGYAPIKLTNYDLIVVNVGTNDVGNGRSVTQIEGDMIRLFETIRIMNKHATITIASILNRPCDDNTSRDTVNNANAAFVKLCTNKPNSFYLRTASIFRLDKNCLKIELFTVEGLHLNSFGKKRIGGYLSSMLGNGNIRTMLRRYPGK